LIVNVHQQNSLNTLNRTHDVAVFDHKAINFFQFNAGILHFLFLFSVFLGREKSLLLQTTEGKATTMMIDEWWKQVHYHRVGTFRVNIV